VKLDKSLLNTILEITYLHNKFKVFWFSMFITDKKPLAAPTYSDNSFFVREVLWLTEEQTAESLYQQITFKVLRKPNKLFTHIQRIFLTYSLGMQEQLYAALVDLLWVLNGKGTALSKRMLEGTRSVLTKSQVNVLEGYIQQADRALLPANQFSICTSGSIDTRELLFTKNENKQQYDALKLARDFIEFSQLEEALETLEQAILKTPERQDVLKELLDLLKITKNYQAFTKIRDIFIQRELGLSAEWQELADYFVEINNEKE